MNYPSSQDEFDPQAKVSTNSKLATIVAKKDSSSPLLIPNNHSYGLKIFKVRILAREKNENGNLTELRITLNQ